ncbi:MAG: response regulator transcription factor [Clostridia bacterium]|nr:response regulator transcription factor [Clostridia bacterium]
MKILLAEDTKDLNRAVTAILEHEGYEVDSFFDGEAALAALLSSGYDGAVLDIMMPKLDGMEVLAEIRRRHVLVPVLMLTAKSQVEDRVAGLDAGADDYLPKPFAMKELIARVRSMTRRRTEYREEAMRFADVTLTGGDLALTSSSSVRLSIKEFELMQALLANTDLALSTEAILRRVWGSEPDATDDTVWLYVSYLKGKLSSIGSRLTISGERGGAYKLLENDR